MIKRTLNNQKLFRNRALKLKKLLSLISFRYIFKPAMRKNRDVSTRDGAGYMYCV